MTNQCGYCRRNNWRNNWTLVPVIVTSRGERVKSKSHKTCIPKWRKIADIQIDLDTDDRFEKELAQQTKVYLEQILPQQDLIRTRRYAEQKRLNGDKRCVDCGKSIHRQSTRCNTCHTAYQHRTFRNPNKDNS